MASRKSGKSKQSRRERRLEQERFEHLKRKVEQGPFPVEKMVIEPSGEVKMSEVLTDFVKPYMESVDTEESYRKLLTLAVLAWNVSFLPDEKGQEMLDKVLGQGVGFDKKLVAGLKGIVNMLIARKKRYFSKYDRQIIDFELISTEEGYHLTVASTLNRKAEE